MEKRGLTQILLTAEMVLATFLLTSFSATAIPSTIPVPLLRPFLPQLLSPGDPPTSCVAELVALSPCLLYISAPPNSALSSPSATCCDAFSFYVLCGDGNIAGPACLCHLVRDPMLLGFPILAERVAALFRACGPAVAGDVLSYGFLSLCQAPGIPLPPLRAGPSVDARAPTKASNSSSEPAVAPAPFVSPVPVSKEHDDKPKPRAPDSKVRTKAADSKAKTKAPGSVSAAAVGVQGSVLTVFVMLLLLAAQ